jgi:regulator of sirC expression with transglutaminase-like and TPR domain
MSEFAGNPEFSKLVAGQNDADLVHLMLEFAGDAYPELDRVECLLAIDHLAVACGDRRASRAADSTPDRLAAISRVLYEVEGFHGNRDDYYDPQNSYLNAVLERRCGIPISLGILYMAVAARTGLKMFGVNTPGHFVIGCSCAGSAWYVDPFTCGDVLNQDDCRRRIEQMVGKSGVVWQQHFRPATSLEIAARVLRNLKAAYAMQEQWPEVLRVQRRLAALLPQVADERRDLGLVYLRLGEPVRALSMLEPYLIDCPSEEAESLRPSIQAARRMAAERN